MEILRNAACVLAFLALASIAPAQQIFTWNGSVDSDWSNSSNWTPVGVPSGIDDAIIAATANSPSTNGVAGATCGILDVNASASLEIAAGFPLAVEGNTVIDGSITGAGVLVLQGGGTATSPGGNTIPNIDVTGAYSFSGDFHVTGDLRQLAGASLLNFGAGTILVDGNASFTGDSIVDGGTATLDVNGNITMATTSAVTTPPFFI